MQNTSKLLETMPVKLIGSIQITNADTGEVLYKKDNTIQAFAAQCVAALLAQNTTFYPNTIKVYLSAVNIATSSVTLLSNPTTTSVALSALFNTSSFTGPMDEAHLDCSTLGSFSKVTGISYTKPASTSIYITWTITVA